jgi:hypothetical protein
MFKSYIDPTFTIFLYIGFVTESYSYDLYTFYIGFVNNIFAYVAIGFVPKVLYIQYNVTQVVYKFLCQVLR